MSSTSQIDSASLHNYIYRKKNSSKHEFYNFYLSVGFVYIQSMSISQPQYRIMLHYDAA
jgi:hypothetical protein